MITLKLWSNDHQRTPVDIFVYEPFDFAKEHATATPLEVCPGLFCTGDFARDFAEDEAGRWRPQDLIEIEELQRAR